MSKAAKELRLAQPTLSAQLKQFESFLDKRLFLREGRKMELSEEGHEVLRYAALIFDLGKEFIDRQGDFSKKGRIRVQVGVVSTVPKTLVMLGIEAILKNNTQAYPTITQGSSLHLMSELRDHLLDAVVCDHLPVTDVQDELQFQLLAQTPVYFCVAPKFKKLARSFPKSLAQIPFILPTHSSATLEATQTFLTERKIEPRIALEVQDVEIARRMALAGHGFAALNLRTIERAPAAESLLVLGRSLEPICYEKTYLIYKKRKSPHPIIQQLIDRFKTTK